MNLPEELEPELRSQRDEYRLDRPVGKHQYDPDQVAAVILQTNGVLANAAVILGCHRVTVSHYVRDFPIVAEALAAAKEATKDWVENRLLQLIDEGNVAATIFYLKTQARDRGFEENPKVIEVHRQPITIIDMDTDDI